MQTVLRSYMVHMCKRRDRFPLSHRHSTQHSSPLSGAWCSPLIMMDVRSVDAIIIRVAVLPRLAFLLILLLRLLPGAFGEPRISSARPKNTSKAART